MKYLRESDIRRMKAAGLTQAQIGKLLNCSQMQVSKYSRAYGISWEIGFARHPKTAKTNLIDGLGKSTIERLTRQILLDAKRDLITCQRCGYVDFTKQELPRHHKDRDRSNNEADNLEVLCWGCHTREHMTERVRDANGRFVS